MPSFIVGVDPSLDNHVKVEVQIDGETVPLTITHTDGITKIKAPPNYRWKLRIWGTHMMNVMLIPSLWLNAFLSGPTLHSFMAFLKGYGGEMYHAFLAGKGGKFFGSFLAGIGGKYFGAFMYAIGGRFFPAYTKGPRYCPVRNGPPVEEGTDRTYENMRGNFNLIGYQEDFYPGPPNGTWIASNQCCSESYIYYLIMPMSVAEVPITVYEYELATGSIRSVELYSDPEANGWIGYIAFLEDRKVLCYPGNDMTELLYIVDFEDLSKTDINDGFYIYGVNAIERENGDIYIIVNESGTVYIKNYTEDSSWESVSTNGGWLYYAFVQDRYWVLPSDGGTSMNADIIDIVDATVETTGNVTLTQNAHGGWPTLGDCQGDYETGCVYCFVGAYTYDNIYFPDHNASVVILIKIDPVAATISTVLTNNSDDPPNPFYSYWGRICSSKNYAYFFENTPTGTGDIIRCHDLSTVGNFTQYYNSFYVAALLNDDESYWYVDRSSDTVKHSTASGSVIGSYSIPHRLHPYTPWIDNLSNATVYGDNMQQSSSYNHWYHIYLIT